MIKKTLILFALLLVVLSGCTRPEPVNWQEKDEQHSGDYTVSYNLDKIEVAIGGKKYQTSMSSIQSGGAKVGDVTIPADIAAKLNESLPKNFRFKINGPGQITATNLENNKENKGLFLPRKNSFVFGQAEKIDPPSKNCGAVGGTLISGDFATAKIENGKTTVGFIAGCTPIIVGARATITWSATKY